MNQDSQKCTKPFKLCFSNEIHRIGKQPADYKSLVQNVMTAFKPSLPLNWALQYEDVDGDKIMLTSEDDYRAMIECEAENASKSIKIYLVPLEEGASGLDLSIIRHETFNNSTIIDKPQPKVEEVKPDEIIEVPTESVERTSTPVIKETEVVKQESPVAERVCENTNQQPTYVNVVIDVPQASALDSEEVPVRKCCPKFKKGDSKFREARRLKMKGIMNDVVRENVPEIAKLVSEYLQNPQAFIIEAKRKEDEKNSADKVVHNRVTCDGCGTNPITGIRYKCSVCEDFDYCEDCEAKVEHPHPFLKIKNPSQHPRAVITILEEDSDNVQSRIESLSRSFQGNDFAKFISDKLSMISKINIPESRTSLADKINNLNEEIVPKHQEEVQQKLSVSRHVEEEEKVMLEKKSSVQRKEVDVPSEVKISPYEVTFVKELCTIPAKIGPQDKAIYKTIVIKNTGRSEWPHNFFLRNVGGVRGQDVKLLNLAPGKEFSSILILEGPIQPNETETLWRPAYFDEKNQIQFSGEPLKLTVRVEGSDLSKSNIKPAEVQVVVEKEEPKEEPKVEVPKKIYSKEVQEKAKQVKEIFIDADLDNLLEFISNSPKLTLEELLNNYLG